MAHPVHIMLTPKSLYSLPFCTHMHTPLPGYGDDSSMIHARGNTNPHQLATPAPLRSSAYSHAHWLTASGIHMHEHAASRRTDIYSVSDQHYDIWKCSAYTPIPLLTYFPTISRLYILTSE